MIRIVAVLYQKLKAWLYRNMSNCLNTNSTNPPLIVFDDVTLGFGGETYFEHTHWSIERGKHWAVIGDNDSGKSLFMGALLGRIPPVSGRICYYFDPAHDIPRLYFKRGEIVALSPEHHRHMVMQYGYHQARWQSFESDGVARVADFLSGTGIERISPYEVTPLQTDETVYRTRRDEVMGLLGIEYLLERKLLHLSNGELHKVLLAQALMQSPRLLVLDEPFCGLDTDSRDFLAQVINRIIAAGTVQILLLTTEIAEIPEGITDIMVLANHRIITQGPKVRLDETDPVNPKRRIQSSSYSGFKPGEQFPVWQPEPSISNMLVEMRKVSVIYGETQVLKEIDWQIKRGERWAVLGHNGAGKSTLLSLILADNPQVYANNIKLFGKRLEPGTGVWEIRRKIGHVSPELHICYPGGWTCEEVIGSGFHDSIGLYRDCTAGQRAAVESWIRYLQLSGRSKQPFDNFSSGEQRLILLARALVKSPGILILDEPCQGLDLEFRTRFLNLLTELSSQTEISILYVTHRRDEMPVFLTHRLWIEHGRIVEKLKINKEMRD